MLIIINYRCYIILLLYNSLNYISYKIVFSDYPPLPVRKFYKFLVGAILFKNHSCAKSY